MSQRTRAFLYGVQYSFFCNITGAMIATAFGQVPWQTFLLAPALCYLAALHLIQMRGTRSIKISSLVTAALVVGHGLQFATALGLILAGRFLNANSLKLPDLISGKLVLFGAYSITAFTAGILPALVVSFLYLHFYLLSAPKGKSQVV